ncbi:HXXEE domain-containing protein [Paenibacillus sp. MMS18-CY102]|uniref:HXXEE domain-containing protein n=1 Tax=Paenibacillus sp. MMS18-CY102 TaxID=2682849 RepID=UPI001365578E|nr:HXXEE domain-containing protein [Paenibacillus sp. MMS18-CY102]MWC28606.1 HXXEE domain-containing protein [Paenibacillus sp. MMS18-CY102]
MLAWLDSALSLQSLIWLFLAAFMIHDFEEIIVIESWMKRNFHQMQDAVPAVFRRKLREMGNVRADRFAFAVALEFIVFIPATWLAAEREVYLFFAGFNVVLLIHVLTHLGQSLIVRKYTPGVVTAILVTLPYSVYLLYRMADAEVMSMNMIVKSLPIGFLLLPLIIAGHKLAQKILP